MNYSETTGVNSRLVSVAAKEQNITTDDERRWPANDTVSGKRFNRNACIETTVRFEQESSQVTYLMHLTSRLSCQLFLNFVGHIKHTLNANECSGKLHRFLLDLSRVAVTDEVVSLGTAFIL